MGESCYRLMSKNGEFIYLRTTGSLEIDQDTNKVQTFICVNTLVSEKEGKELIEQMKRDFSVTIASAELDAHLEATAAIDVPAVESPQQMERAIMNLITNLHPPGFDEYEGVASPGAASDHMSSTTILPALCSPAASTSSMCSFRETKSPSLTIIAPKVSSIKPSIERATCVMGNKNLSSLTSPRSSVCDDFDDDDETDDFGNESDSTTHSNNSRPSVLQQNLSYSKTVNGGKNLKSPEHIQIKLEPGTPVYPYTADAETRLPPLPTSTNYNNVSDYASGSGCSNNHHENNTYPSSYPSTASQTITYTQTTIINSPQMAQQRTSVLKRTHNDEIRLPETNKKQRNYLNHNDSNRDSIIMKSPVASPEQLLEPCIQNLINLNSGKFA